MSCYSVQQGRALPCSQPHIGAKYVSLGWLCMHAAHSTEMPHLLFLLCLNETNNGPSFPGSQSCQDGPLVQTLCSYHCAMSQSSPQYTQQLGAYQFPLFFHFEHKMVLWCECDTICVSSYARQSKQFNPSFQPSSQQYTVQKTVPQGEIQQQAIKSKPDTLCQLSKNGPFGHTKPSFWSESSLSSHQQFYKPVATCSGMQTHALASYFENQTLPPKVSLLSKAIGPRTLCQKTS